MSSKADRMCSFSGPPITNVQKRVATTSTPRKAATAGVVPDGAVGKTKARVAVGPHRHRGQRHTDVGVHVLMEQRLAQERLILIGIPVEKGGAGGTVHDVMEAVIEVARANSRVAQALRASFATARTVTTRRIPTTRALSLRRLLDGGLFASTTNERGGKSGSFADGFSDSAITEDGHVGQRLCASGVIRLTNVEAGHDEVVRPSDGFDRFWRNSRTVVNHNPRDRKPARIGSYLLMCEEPPTAGLV